MAVNESLFPELAARGYKITSPADSHYNCIAWAAGQTSLWWWPDPSGIDYWPANVPREATLHAFVQVFATLGYEPCEDVNLDPKWEKIAIYVRDEEPTHATRQLASGKWTSKLGPDEDIEHDLESLAGPAYGTVAQVLRREKASL